MGIICVVILGGGCLGIFIWSDRFSVGATSTTLVGYPTTIGSIWTAMVPLEVVPPSLWRCLVFCEPLPPPL